jgi:hypothetical protein
MSPHRLPIPEDFQEPKRRFSACCGVEVVSARRYRATATSPEEWDERCGECGQWCDGEYEEERP